MNIYSLKQEIETCEERIIYLRKKINKNYKLLDNLNELLYKFHSKYDCIQQNLYRRKKNLSNLSFNANEIKMYRTYQKEVSEMLDGNQIKIVLAKQEDSQSQIQNNINLINNEIDDFQNEIRKLENEMSHLYQEIKCIEWEEQ